MAAIVSQHVYHFGCHLEVFKNLILRKTAANLLKLVENMCLQPQIINYAQILSNGVNQLTSKDAHSFRLQVLKVSFYNCLKASNFRSEKPMGGGGSS